MSANDELKISAIENFIDDRKNTNSRDQMAELAEKELKFLLNILRNDEKELARLRAVEAAVHKLEKTAEEHRSKYDHNANHKPLDESDYWDGRRDEAGFFRDKLAAALKESETE